MHLRETPRPLRQLVHDLPAHVEDAVARALARTREERYESMTAFMSALLGKQEAYSVASLSPSKNTEAPVTISELDTLRIESVPAGDAFSPTADSSTAHTNPVAPLAPIPLGLLTILGLGIALYFVMIGALSLWGRSHNSDPTGKTALVSVFADLSPGIMSQPKALPSETPVPAAPPKAESINTAPTMAETEPIVSKDRGSDPILKGMTGTQPAKPKPGMRMTPKEVEGPKQEQVADFDVRDWRRTHIIGHEGPKREQVAGFNAPKIPTEDYKVEELDPDKLIKDALQAWFHGQYAAAVDLSRKALLAHPDSSLRSHAYQIIGVCSCALHDFASAESAYNQLDERNKLYVRSACKKNGIVF